MKRHNWDGIPQGQKYVSFTGMQGEKQIGNWVEVGQLAIVQKELEMLGAIQLNSTVEVEPISQQEIEQGDTGPVTSYL